MKNIEFYYDEIFKLETFPRVLEFAEEHGKIIETGTTAMQDILDWLNSEHQILDDVEKKYLKNVINPFMSRVTYIMKTRKDNLESVDIFYRDGSDINCINLPYFKADTMYKGMKPGKAYKLEDLGLLDK